MKTITLAAETFENHDDCLAAAAAWYIDQHPELTGWDLDARWASDERDEILLSVPA